MPQAPKPDKSKTRRQKKGRTVSNTSVYMNKHVRPKTVPQEQVFEMFHQNHLLLNGSAGTGKTYIALYLALREVLERPESGFERVIIVRSAVQTRDLGFMKGSLDEKVMHFEAPYRDIVSDLCGRDDAYDVLKAHKVVQFMCTSFVRGLTLDNAIIIVDEAQNNTGHELDSVITRLGAGSKIVLCGDYHQSDLKGHDKTGFSRVVKILEAMRGVETISFTRSDIVRSDFVKQYICAKEDIEQSLG